MKTEQYVPPTAGRPTSVPSDCAKGVTRRLRTEHTLKSSLSLPYTSSCECRSLWTLIRSSKGEPHPYWLQFQLQIMVCTVMGMTSLTSQYYLPVVPTASVKTFQSLKTLHITLQTLMTEAALAYRPSVNTAVAEPQQLTKHLPHNSPQSSSATTAHQISDAT